VVTQQIGAQLYHPLSQLYVQVIFLTSSGAKSPRWSGISRTSLQPAFAATRGWTMQPAVQHLKLGKIDIQVGYLSGWVDFSKLDICPDDHFGNVQRANRFGVSARYGSG